MAQSSCRESKGLWTDKNNWEKQATLIASATCAAFPHNGFIYKSSSKVLQDKLILMLMSIMMRDERYAMWSWSMPPWILGNLLLGPSAVMCTRKKRRSDRICFVDEKMLSISLSVFPLFLRFFIFFLLRDQVDALVQPAARWANDERESIAASIVCWMCTNIWACVRKLQIQLLTLSSLARAHVRC